MRWWGEGALEERTQGPWPRATVELCCWSRNGVALSGSCPVYGHGGGLRAGCANLAMQAGSAARSTLSRQGGSGVFYLALRDAVFLAKFSLVGNFSQVPLGLGTRLGGAERGHLRRRVCVHTDMSSAQRRPRSSTRVST